LSLSAQCFSCWSRSSCLSSCFVFSSSRACRSSEARRSADARSSSSLCARFAAFCERSSSLRAAAVVDSVVPDEASRGPSSSSLLLLLLLLPLVCFPLCEPRRVEACHVVWREVERETVKKVKCPFGLIVLFFLAAALYELCSPSCSSLSATHGALRGAVTAGQTFGDESAFLCEGDPLVVFCCCASFRFALLVGCGPAADRREARGARRVGRFFVSQSSFLRARLCRVACGLRFLLLVTRRSLLRRAFWLLITRLEELRHEVFEDGVGRGRVCASRSGERTESAVLEESFLLKQLQHCLDVGGYGCAGLFHRHECLGGSDGVNAERPKNLELRACGLMEERLQRLVEPRNECQVLSRRHDERGLSRVLRIDCVGCRVHDIVGLSVSGRFGRCR
jgi:hypothetical protein